MKHSDETCLFTECSGTTLYSSHRPNDNDANRPPSRKVPR